MKILGMYYIAMIYWFALNSSYCYSLKWKSESTESEAIENKEQGQKSKESC